ncbi:hypothetical protein M9Y10_028423 [Tritrichomonas musculus]|uniref:Uncharacterized protein n=1 Tax=Tritrichomonas musculus TaxID=1915356 RepID=A0ABR2KKD7_9EUKA
MENKNTFRDYLLIVSKEIQDKALDAFQNKYVNFEIDSGTVSKLNIIHCIISLTEEREIHQFLYKLVQNNHFDHLDYFEWTSEFVSRILDKNIIICSIIIDNLRAQTKGIELLKQLLRILE